MPTRCQAMQRPDLPLSWHPGTVPSGADRGADAPLLALLRTRLVDLERRLSGLAEVTDPWAKRSASAAAGVGGVEAQRPEQRSLQDVRAALARLETGRYGRCSTCDTPIERERLIERPQVPRCSRCDGHGDA